MQGCSMEAFELWLIAGISTATRAPFLEMPFFFAVRAFLFRLVKRGDVVTREGV